MDYSDSKPTADFPRPSVGNETRWKAGVPIDRRRRRLNARSVAEMMALMVGGKPTMHELVEHSGLCIHTVRAYIKAMHLIRACHISGWTVDKRGAFMTPQWSMGGLADVSRPPPLDNALRMKAYRKAQRLRKLGLSVPSVALIARTEEMGRVPQGNNKG